jgi:hypothetical protein
MARERVASPNFEEDLGCNVVETKTLTDKVDTNDNRAQT